MKCSHPTVGWSHCPLANRLRWSSISGTVTNSSIKRKKLVINLIEPFSFRGTVGSALEPTGGTPTTPIIGSRPAPPDPSTFQCAVALLQWELVKSTKCDAIRHVHSLASPAVGHWGTCPPPPPMELAHLHQFGNFQFSSLLYLCRNFMLLPMPLCLSMTCLQGVSGCFVHIETYRLIFL